MKKMKLGFFVGVALVAFPLLCKAQSNSLGDRGSAAIEEPSQKIQKPRITRKQKLLFRKPNARHSTEYKFSHRLEQVAREKQRIVLRQIKLRGIAHARQTAEFEFYKRAEKVAREKQHKLIKMANPQYSNFAYFGHKHLPKKHLPYAMRYCKECGMRH